MRPSYKLSILSQQDIEVAQKSVADAVNTAANKSQRSGQYNSYSKEQRARIAKYAAENGTTCAAKHYSAVWGIPIYESTARRLESQYLEKLREEPYEQCKKLAESQEASTSGESIVITELETRTGYIGSGVYQ